MTSYLSSYFGASTSSTITNPSQPPNTWTSTVSSRITTLRKALTKDAEDDHPDNEDCSHVSNVLRAYYTEKGRPFPEWLPPDPTKPVIQQQQQQQPQQPGYAQYGSMFPGNHAVGGGAHSRGGSGGRAGLSDLWDAGPGQPVAQVQSLRAQRVGREKTSSGGAGLGTDGARASLGPRPMLPSQYSSGSQQSGGGGGGVGSGPALPTLASRDRLRARLQGSGRQSPANGSDGGSYSGAGGVYRSQSNGNDYNTNAREQQAQMGRSASNADAYDPYSYQLRPR